MQGRDERNQESNTPNRFHRHIGQPPPRRHRLGVYEQSLLFSFFFSFHFLVSFLQEALGVGVLLLVSLFEVVSLVALLWDGGARGLISSNGSSYSTVSM
ncbi:hypothetical protein BDV26DRAFT_133787 [Aspergillus bertholletiae]|uniref:Uncharacterized protein n=1 Tax=Aspergillus bertholletiae TaxID=1226010 RepID=A0A5N7ANE1_9EURO|nr:hypothetical protein BDV26DRAFT_133787 [Aspergillus bertholletiae]